MGTPPKLPPTPGLPPSGSRSATSGNQANMFASSRVLALAAILHGAAAPATWYDMETRVRQLTLPLEQLELLYLIMAIGIAGQLGFAVIAGAGAHLVSKGGPKLMMVGTLLLFMGIIALVFSVAIAGGIAGILGFLAGFLTAYAGNKVRKPSMPKWIPPSSWTPPPQGPQSP